MKNSENKNLLVFGYGLALISAYLLACKIVPEKPHFLIIVITLIGILYVLSNIERPRMRFTYYMAFAFVYAVSAFWSVCQLKDGVLVQSIRFWPIVVLVASGICFVLTKINPKLLESFLRIWMKGVHFIGSIFSTVALGIIFYFIFTPVGIFFQLTRKDLLDKKMEPEKESYWLAVEDESSDEERYLKQF